MIGAIGKILIILSLFLTSCGDNNGYSSVSKSTFNIENYDLNTDVDNCGAVGYACVNGRSCNDGICVPAWQSINTYGAPTPRGVAGAGFVNGKYIFFGGCTEYNLNPSESSGGVYDPDLDSWDILSPLNEGRAQFSTVTTEDGVFVYGGIYVCFDGGTVGAGLEVIFNYDGNWTAVPTNINANYSAAMTYTGYSLFLYGGQDNYSPYLNNAAIISLGSQGYNIQCELSNCERTGATAFMDHNIVHILGGNNSVSYFPSGLLYDLDAEQWYTWVLPENTPDFYSLKPFPSTPVRYVDDGRRLFYIGSDNVVYIYDRNSQTWITDNSDVPEGFCSEGAVAWTGSELIQYSGMCDFEVFSSIGARYQPPAPIN